jgi:hypothetical protein
MQTIWFQRFLMFVFCLSIIKGAKKGATSELISLIFFCCGIALMSISYKNTQKIILFSLVYSLGLFLAYCYQKRGVMQAIFGGIIGVIKFFIMLSTMIAIIDAAGIITPQLRNTFFIRHAWTTSQRIKKIIS